MGRRVLLLTAASLAIGLLGDGTGRGDARAPAGPVTLHFSFVAGRRLVIEDCGCSIRPWGSIAREAAALAAAREKHEVVGLAAGNAFLPGLASREAPTLTAQRRIVEGWNRMRLAAFHPSARDLTIGPESLSLLADTADFPFVVTNATVPSTRRFALVETGGRRVLVAGILDDKLVPKGLSPIPAAAALSALVAEKRGAFDLLVVLSSLEGDAGAEALRGIGVPAILFEESGGVSAPLSLLTPSVVSVRAAGEGRDLALLSVEWLPGATRFTDPQEEEAEIERIVARRLQLASLRSELSRVTARAKRRKLRAEIAALEAIPEPSDEAVPGIASPIRFVLYALDQTHSSDG